MLIYLPETAFDTEQFIRDVETALEKTPNVIVCISEGSMTGKGLLSVSCRAMWAWTRSGTRCSPAPEISGKSGQRPTRRESPLDRAQCMPEVFLCHAFRDRPEGGDRFRAYGVKCALEGETGKMVAFRRVPGEDYRVDYVTEDINLICNQEKGVL